MTGDENPGPATRTISRAMRILHAFDETRPEMGVTTLSQVTGLDKSTVYRLLNALQQGGLVDQDPDTAKYYLGLGLVRLAGLALQRMDLPRIARPHLEELAQRTEETISLSVMTSDYKLMSVESIASPRRVRSVGWIGREMPLHAVSGGKVLMAFLPPEQLDPLVTDGLQAFTEHTITDLDRLRAELHEIRRAGYGLSEEELEEGLSAVSAPVRNLEEKVVAIVSVSGPSSRLPHGRLIELGETAKKTAGRISQQIR